MDVSENYTLEWSGPLTLMTIVFIALLFWALKGSAKFQDKVLGRKVRLGTMVGLTLSVCLFMQLNSERYYDSWNEFANGYAYTFAINIKMLHTEVPEDYNAFRIAQEMNQLEEKDKFSDENLILTDRGDDERASEEENSEKPEKPNIIAIMNESFSDMATVGDFETNMPVTPFLDSLEGSSIQGNLAVSVFGGGTCDSEYSFLTGNTTAFLPENTRPYQLYVKEGAPSLVSTLNAQGYHSEAIHPGVRTAWNRDNVYGDFGFKAFYSAENFINAKMTRGLYVSDESTYDQIIDIYEHKLSGQPLFVFDVTIQNHGPYYLDASDLDIVRLEGMEGEYPLTEQYLSLIHNSDQAFEKLVTYFEGVEEPTIIVMFGDHQAKIETEFYEEVIGKPQEEWTLEELQRTYQTPYVIWANYPLNSQEGRLMSVQNLASYLLDQTGLEQTDYNRYLSALAKELPVVNSQGVVDAQGNNYAYGEDNPYNEEILTYQRILYNNIFDKENRQDQLYFIQEDSTEEEPWYDFDRAEQGRLM
ncbi:MAG: LTA synthase family protein [Eubacterium sp.]|nr:LTA synthase family protein [Eubacterium sp.]